MIHSVSFPGSHAKCDRRISFETHDLECVRPTDRPEMGRWACTSRCPKADEETIEFGFFQAWLRRSMVAPKTRATTPREKPRRPVATRAGASSTRHRPGYPLSGCSAAEPNSVSPGNSDYSSARPPADDLIQNRPNAPTGSNLQNPARRPLLKPSAKDITTH